MTKGPNTNTSIVSFNIFPRNTNVVSLSFSYVLIIKKKRFKYFCLATLVKEQIRKIDEAVRFGKVL